MKPLHLDTDEFTRLASNRSGVIPIDSLSRLSSLLSGTDGELDWHLDGSSRRRSDGSLEREMRLRLDGRLRLICSRCLRPRDFDLKVDRKFLLATSEAEALTLDDLNADADVLVGGRRFNLSDLIEDEVILALPSVATHSDCRLEMSAGTVGNDAFPSPSVQSLMSDGRSAETEAETTRRPLAALANLKAKRRS